MFYFFDTSALIKLYHPEDGSLLVRKLFEDPLTNNCIARLTFTEFYAGFYKKLKVKDIVQESTVLLAINSFEVDMQDVWVIAMHDKIFESAQNLLKRYGSKYLLRTLDALQLACAEIVAQSDDMTFITADKEQQTIAIEMGFSVIFATDIV